MKNETEQEVFRLEGQVNNLKLEIQNKVQLLEDASANLTMEKTRCVSSKILMYCSLAGSVCLL